MVCAIRVGHRTLSIRTEHGTPVNGTPAPGTATPPENTAEPCRVQALILEQDGTALVLLTADLIWFSSPFADAFRRRVALVLKLDPACICLAASHAHGTPQTDPRFGYGSGTAAFRRHVLATVFAALRDALAAPRRTVTWWRGTASAPGLAVNRRRVAWRLDGGRPVRRVQNLPNPSRPAPDTVTILEARDDDGRAVCALVHFTCHPVTDPGGMPGGDYPAALCRMLEQRAAIPSVMFLQGFCGDVRPHLRHQPVGAKDRIVEWLIGPRFRKSRPNDRLHMAQALEAACLQARAQAAPLDIGAVQAAQRLSPLRLVNGDDAGRALCLVRWRLAPDFGLLFTNAEVASGLDLRNSDGLLSVGYSNGMTAYVVPSPDMPQGGYEVDGFLARFALPARLSFETGNEFLDIRRALATPDTRGELGE